MKIKPKGKSGGVVVELKRGESQLPGSKDAKPSPFRMRTILVPVDFSECSSKALQYALPLAKQHEATITLIYVVPNPAYVAAEYGIAEFALLEPDIRARAEKNLANFVNQELKGKVPVNTVVRIGSPSVEIVEVAKSIEADIIVVSTHGRSGLKHILLGSVAEHVVRHAPCPVLVVREREHEFLAS